MAVFKVETKNKVDIDKKPRVYFTCHPDDFEKHFKKVCNDIFKTHDCAIYYTEDMTEVIAEDEKQVDLGRNNLFVVPITFKLLTTPNRAMDEDIPYALKEHIPVLPIMMEPGIDELYSKPDKFGELQYLNPYSTDLTEISYEEKLKKYLKSILISDKLAKRVRAAFDAYIFLSYRKKDRKYANELMRLIHSNHECRDIAIWFDEFLTPGESFKENIEKILDDCKLFTLLVTPQLLEKVIDEHGEEQDNYVISTELPLARKKKEEKGTDIFAVEMEDTDKEALSSINIEDYVNSSDLEFRTRLLDAISRMAITTNDTPEHNFLIGLAYLEGIDVEVNFQKAISIITDSAEQGLEEATEKLADIYFTGQGCFIDYKQSAVWRKKSVEQKYVKYQASKDIYDANLLISALYELGECYSLSGEHEKSLTTYEHMIRICKKNRNYLMQIIAVMSMVRVYQEFRDFKKAKNLIKRHKKNIRNAFENLSSEQSEYFYTQGLTSGIVEATFVGLIGEIYTENKNLREAERWFQKQRTVLLKEQQHQNDFYVMFCLVENQLNLCDILKRKYLFQKADEKILADIKEKSDECIKNIETIYSIYGEDSESEKSWLLAHQFLGWVYETKELLDEAVKIYTAILQKQEQIVKKRPDYESKNNLAVVCDCLGRVIFRQGNPKQAKDFLERSLAIREPFSQTSNAKKNTLCSLHYLGETYKALRDWSSAMGAFQKALDIGLALRQELQNADWLDSMNLMLLSGACINMAEISIDKKEYTQAKHFLDLTRSFTVEPEGVFSRSKGIYLGLVGYLHTQYGVLYTYMAQEERALKHYLKSIHFFEQKQKIFLEEFTYIHLSCACFCASVLSENESAVLYIKKAKACLDKRREKFPEVEENISCSEMVMQRLEDLT